MPRQGVSVLARLPGQPKGQAMNWDQLRQDLDAAVRAQSVAVIDEVIVHLQEMRARLVKGDMSTPPRELAGARG